MISIQKFNLELALKKKQTNKKPAQSPWIEHCAFILRQCGKLSAFPAMFSSSFKHLKGPSQAGLVGRKGVNREKNSKGVKREGVPFKFLPPPNNHNLSSDFIGSKAKKTTARIINNSGFKKPKLII